MTEVNWANADNRWGILVTPFATVAIYGKAKTCYKSNGQYTAIFYSLVDSNYGMIASGSYDWVKLSVPNGEKGKTI